jgi:RNA polymerase sigma factor (sigma-70 family)
MEQHSTPKDAQTIRHQFDSFVKKVLRGEVCTYRKELARRSQHEVDFSELSEKELNTLYTTDEYPSDHYAFRVLGYDVAVKNPFIGAALDTLPDKKRDIILLAYFLDMTDTEIAKRLNLVNSTIHHHRTSTLNLLHKLLEKEYGADEKQDEP